MSQSAIAAAIAHKVYEAERINAAMLGHDRTDIVVLSYGAWTETFCRAFETGRPAVHLPCRMISSPVSKAEPHRDHSRATPQP